MLVILRQPKHVLVSHCAYGAIRDNCERGAGTVHSWGKPSPGAPVRFTPWLIRRTPHGHHSQSRARSLASRPELNRSGTSRSLTH